jgi:hypothetical protein
MKTLKVFAALLATVAILGGTMQADAYCGHRGCWHRPYVRAYVPAPAVYYAPPAPYYPVAPVYVAPRVVVRPAPVVVYRPAPRYYHHGGYRRYY